MWAHVWSVCGIVDAIANDQVIVLSAFLWPLMTSEQWKTSRGSERDFWVVTLIVEREWVVRDRFVGTSLIYYFHTPGSGFLIMGDFRPH